MPSQNHDLHPFASEDLSYSGPQFCTFPPIRPGSQCFSFRGKTAVADRYYFLFQQAAKLCFLQLWTLKAGMISPLVLQQLLTDFCAFSLKSYVDYLGLSKVSSSFHFSHLQATCKHLQVSLPKEILLYRKVTYITWKEQTLCLDFLTKSLCNGFLHLQYFPYI